MSGAGDPTRRFGDRVSDYARWRPSYPGALLDALGTVVGFPPGGTLVETGAGTGIFTAQLADRGYRVIAVEPNAAMAAAGAASLDRRASFVRAKAEATGLRHGVGDGYVAAQAFHWYEPEAARAEAVRILRPPRPAALAWNMRRLDATPFLRAYEAFLHEWGVDYREVAARYMQGSAMRAFFGGPYRRARFEMAQRFDLEGLKGRLLSSSYAPAAGHPRHAPMLVALEALFREHARDGEVAFQYDVELVHGEVR